MDHITAEQEVGFWPRVGSDLETGCWIWTGRLTNQGYGLVTVQKRDVAAHRVAWCLYHRKPLPSTDQIRRRCDNRACVAPEHLKHAPATLPMRNGKRFYVLRPPPGTPAVNPLVTTEDLHRITREIHEDTGQSLQEISGPLSALAEALMREIIKVRVLSDIVSRAVAQTSHAVAKVGERALSAAKNSNQVVQLGLDHRIDGLSEHVAGLDGRLGSVEHKLDRMLKSLHFLAEIATSPPEASPAREAASEAASSEPALDDPTSSPAQDDATRKTVEPQENAADEREHAIPPGDGSGLTLQLARGFAEEVGVDVRELGTEDGETLLLTYEIAGNVEDFVRILGDFKQAMMRDETIERSTKAFAQFVATRV